MSALPSPSIKLSRSAYATKLREFGEIAFADERALSQRGAWRDYFSSRIGEGFDGRIILEIGCADGSLLGRIAARHPCTAFVGLDWKCKQLYQAASRISSTRLANVALIRGRAQEIARMFDSREVDDIWIFHPEPCDGPAELPNRLIRESFLIDACAVMRGGASRMCLKTDHAGYYEHVVGACEARSIQERFRVIRRSGNFWGDVSVQRATVGHCFSGDYTPYEWRFVRKRKPIYYFELGKRAS